jgi:hypothetical protein
MKIPKEVVIGNTTHLVRTKKSIVHKNAVCRGFFNEYECTIDIAQGNPLQGYKYDADARANTFWHELTHAILFDMHELKLNANEEFVSAFANRLDQAIKTAKF